MQENHRLDMLKTGGEMESSRFADLSQEFETKIFSLLDENQVLKNRIGQL